MQRNEINSELLKALDFAADALDWIDLACQDSPGEGKRCEECGSCAGEAALRWARQSLRKARGQLNQ